MSLYRDEAIVLRTQKLGEADRIITMLTREHGRIRGVAKGVRRTMSKFGARLEPGSHVDIQMYTGKTFDTVTQVEAIMNYGEAISTDYQRWTIASAILETAERFTAQESEPALQEFQLVVGGMKALAENRYDSSLILDAFLLRSLAIGGYAPSMSQCSRCEKPGPHRYFSLVGGDRSVWIVAHQHLQPPHQKLSNSWVISSAEIGIVRKIVSFVFAEKLVA